MRQKLLISLFLLTGFFIYGQSGVTVVDSIQSGSLWRSYRLYKPTSYTGTTAWPLVLNFHGYTSNAFQQQYYGNFMPIADTAKFLVVHPQGTLDGSNQPYWNAGLYPTGVNDLQFVSELIDTLKAHYNIDANMIYSTGLSNGGFMSNYLACNLSNKIAAIASVAGTMFSSFSGTCNPSRPVPSMHIHGTADGTVPYNGATGMIPADSLTKYWRVHNGCSAAPTFTNLPDIVPADGCTATRYLWAGGVSGVSDELYKINGGGHTWPGASVIVGTTNEDFNASVEIWRFFRKYKLNQLTGVAALENDSETLSVYPNPAHGQITIASDKESVSCELYDALGNKVRTGTGHKLDASGLPAGIYILRINVEGKPLVRKIVVD